MTGRCIADLLLESNRRISDERQHVLRANRSDDEIIVFLEDFKPFSVGEIAEGLSWSAIDSNINSIAIFFCCQADEPIREELIMEFHRNGTIQLTMILDDAIRYYRVRECRSLLESVFTRIGVSVERVEHNDNFRGWDFEAQINDPTITMGELSKCAQQAIGRVCLPEDDKDNDRRGEVLRKLHAGLFDELVGEPETSWLEFKSSADLDSETGRVELARDVARFANSEKSGVLVIGLRTSRVDGIDIATKVTPVSAADHNCQRYLDIVDQRVYPPVRGLEIYSIGAGKEHAIIVIIIPAQREQDKPFLVHGEVIDERTERVFFSIVRRRGESSIPVTAREVHALLAAGYRTMRRDV